MLIGGPDFDRLVGMLGGEFGEHVGKVFLYASASCGLAAFGFLGRGEWIDQPIARSASQPRCGASFASPILPAIQFATLRLVHNPPSGGGSARRIFNRSSRSGLRTDGAAPL